MTREELDNHLDWISDELDEANKESAATASRLNIAITLLFEINERLGRMVPPEGK